MQQVADMEYVTLVVFACALWGANGFPSHHYGTNMDTMSYGSSNGGIVLSRFYTPHNNPGIAAGSGMAAFMFHPEEHNQQASQYYLPDRRHLTTPETLISLENENSRPQTPEKAVATEATEIADPLPTDKVEIATTVKALTELAETETEELEEPKEIKEIALVPKKRITKKKQIKKPIYDEDEEEEYAARIPTAAFFPMYFGWGGGRSGALSGATAIANAFSTGRGGVATSDATAYGPPQPESKFKN